MILGFLIAKMAMAFGGFEFFNDSIFPDLSGKTYSYPLLLINSKILEFPSCEKRGEILRNINII